MKISTITTSIILNISVAFALNVNVGIAGSVTDQLHSHLYGNRFGILLSMSNPTEDVKSNIVALTIKNQSLPISTVIGLASIRYWEEHRYGTYNGSIDHPFPSSSSAQSISLLTNFNFTPTVGVIFSPDNSILNINQFHLLYTTQANMISIGVSWKIN